MKCKSLGCMISKRVIHDIVMIRSHGPGLSCGMSLRRRGIPLSLA